MESTDSSTAQPPVPRNEWAWTVEGRIESMLDGLRDGVTVHDEHGRLLYANRSAKRTGLVESAAIVFRDDARRAISAEELPFQRVFDVGGSLEQMVCCDRADGSGCEWFRVSTSLVEPAQTGGPTVAVSVWYDVTDLREANEALRLQASVMEAQREASPAGILVLDPQGKLRFWNRRFLRFFGLPEELMASGSGRAVFTAVSRKLNDPQRFERAVTRAAQHRPLEVHAFEVGLTDGRAFEVNGAPVRGRAGERFGQAWFFRDVSERKRAEERERLLLIEQSARLVAEHERKRFASIVRVSELLSRTLEERLDLGAVADACAAWASELCVIDVLDGGRLHRAVRGRPGASARIAHALEDAAAEALPQVHAALAGEGDGTWVGRVDDERGAHWVFTPEQQQGLIDGGLGELVAVRLRPRTGGVHAAITVAGLREPEYEVLRFLRDVAARMELALDNASLLRDLRASMAVRDEFIDVAAHELRTPMTTLLLTAQLTQQQLEKGKAEADAWVRSRTSLLVRQAQRVMRLVVRLLDVTRMTGGTLRLERETFDLGQLVTDIAAQFEEDAARSGARVQVQVEPAAVSADRGRLEEVVQNLVSNALKYGAGTPVELSVTPERDAVLLSVADHGPGIPADEQERIFERYERGTRAGQAAPGLGLGLYLARKIVEAHGGELTVESVPGRGSKFVARLPRSGARGANGPTVH